VHITHGAAGHIPHGLPHPVHDLLDHIAILGEERLTFGRDVIDLLAVGLLDLNVALVFQQLQGRVHRAGRGAVAAGSLFLQRLHHLVPVHRFFLEQAQDDELHLARLEHGATVTSLAPATAKAERKIGAEGAEAPVIS
jgi:hypothetical protein